MNYSYAEIVVLSISLAVIVAISVLLGLVLRKKSMFVRRIPLIIITVILVGMELAKQIIAIAEGYSMWTFPLHFCSTYFIWFSIANFTKGKFQRAMQTVAVVASFYLLALFYFNPTSIIGDACKNVFGSFSSFHTFFFHHLVILYFGLSVALRQFDFKFKYLLHWTISMASYYIIAVVFANIFNTNYMNILTSNIPFMESLRLATGQVFYNIVLGLLTVGVGAAIIALLSWVQKVRLKKLAQKQVEVK